MKLTLVVLALLVGTLTVAPAQQGPDKRKPPITVRTETYPRPPYSGATYYIYEQSERTICTKLEVCNKFGDCSAEYFKGAHRAQEDNETGDPYGQTPAVAIPQGQAQQARVLASLQARMKGGKS